MQELQRWGGGAVKLTQNPAREARNLVWNALDKGIRWFELGENEAAVKKLLGLTGVQVQNIAVDLGGTEAGRALSKSGSTLVTLEPTAANASTLIALFNQSKGVPPEPGGPGPYREPHRARRVGSARCARPAARVRRAHDRTGEVARHQRAALEPATRRFRRVLTSTTAMTPVDGAQAESPRATAWTRAVKEAEDLHRRTLERPDRRDHTHAGTWRCSDRDRLRGGRPQGTPRRSLRP